METKAPIPPRTLATALFFLGIVYGWLTGLSALLMDVMGHGWAAPASSALGMFVVPFFGAAIPYKRQTIGIVYLAICLSGGLVIDCVIWAAIIHEGLAYASLAWRSVPVIMIVWVILWVGWQLTAAYMLLFAVKARRTVAERTGTGDAQHPFV